MKRLVYDPKKCEIVWKNWIPEITLNYGDSCVKKSKYVEDKVRINNNEVSTGTSRTALYTMPGGVDNGVRYSPLYESSGLDITEIEANKRLIENAKAEVEGMIKLSKKISSISSVHIIPEGSYTRFFICSTKTQSII